MIIRLTPDKVNRERPIKETRPRNKQLTHKVSGYSTLKENPWFSSALTTNTQSQWILNFKTKSLVFKCFDNN